MQTYDWDNMKKHWDEYLEMDGNCTIIQAQIDTLFETLKTTNTEKYTSPKACRAMRDSYFRQITFLQDERNKMHKLGQEALKKSSVANNVLA